MFARGVLKDEFERIGNQTVKIRLFVADQVNFLGGLWVSD